MVIGAISSSGDVAASLTTCPPSFRIKEYRVTQLYLRIDATQMIGHAQHFSVAAQPFAHKTKANEMP
jgi:hypothetical protein